MQYSLLLHFNFGWTKVVHCYGMSILPVFFISEFVNNGHNAPHFKAVEYSDLVTLCNSCHVTNLMDFLVDPYSATIDSV